MELKDYTTKELREELKRRTLPLPTKEQKSICDIKTLKHKVKNFLRLPVTRVEVLEHAKELQGTHQYPGLCALLNDALEYYDIWSPAFTIFPKFNIKYAGQFGTYKCFYPGFSIGNWYWWERGRWDTGRLDFLNWLINEYKGDKTNIRKL